MKDFLNKMFSTGDEVSSKRVIGFGAFLALIIMAFIDQLSKYKASEVIVDAFMWIIFAAFFAGAIELFSKRKLPPTVNVQKVDNVQIKNDSPDTTATEAGSVKENEIIG